MLENKFNREEYETFLIQNGCVRLGGKYILSSTKDLSPYHINFREFGNKGYNILLNMIGDFIKENIENHQNYQFVGIPYGAIDIGNQISTIVGNGKRAILRKEKINADKEIDEVFAGPMNPNAGSEIILIEDVLVKGSNITKYLQAVRDCGIEVNKAIILCDRRENASDSMPTVGDSNYNREYESSTDKLKEKGLELFVLTDVHSLIPRAIKRRYSKENVIKLDEKGVQIVFEILQYYGRNGFDRGGIKEGKITINEFIDFPFTQEIIGVGDYFNTKLLQSFIQENVLTAKNF
ncbi:MAG: hypothetical protein KJ767_03195 [Nanoarchaeota archaeon]|nr:hypothetical protein [Nanoarchaeota archaeon]